MLFPERREFMKKIRLIFYLPNLKSYIDRFHLVRKISKSTDKTFLIISQKDIDLTNLKIPDTMEIVELPKGRRYPGRTYFQASKVVAELIDDHDINIVHDTFGHLLFLFKFRKNKYPNCKFITSLFILAEWDFKNYLWKLYKYKFFINKDLLLWLFRIPLQREICKNADKIVLQAPGLVERLQENIKVSKNNITWIPNNIYLPNKEQTKLSKKKSKTIKLIYVGGFGIAKGVLGLLKILKIANERDIDIETIVVGGNVSLDEKTLKDLINKYGIEDKIKFVGRVEYEKVKEYMSECDWLFHMTDVDGSPRVVLEALSRGLPVIGSRHPGIKVLDPEESFIQFTDTNSLNELIEQLVLLKNNESKYSEIVLRGYNYIKNNFESRIACRKYIDLYTKILENKEG
jgi:glycosyltransferase involved in cell wall biosynthesis